MLKHVNAIVEKSFLNICSSLSKNPRGNKALLLVRKQRLRNSSCTPCFSQWKTMEQQSSGQKVSVLSYICHNSGGQLLKRRQSEMRLTARLFRPRLSCTV
ncbi:hypothetical protein T12_12397 [Trichinella patagoniensis]|uniref:Uncharacterized protein n=1 Tax=Trichinella patagoniensis TaxID=990121 RepID=A0A0V0Z9W1_9BILA|nr:hypothetical protein T12_12397 [Trichinella patagoniensis]